MSVGHLGVFFAEMSVQVFCPFLDWIFCSLDVEFDTSYRDLFFFFKILFIYLFDRERNSQGEREHKQGEWERKKQAPRGAHSQGPGITP